MLKLRTNFDERSSCPVANKLPRFDWAEIKKIGPWYDIHESFDQSKDFSDRTGVCGTRWGGSILVMHLYSGSSDYSPDHGQVHQDMDLSDARHAADFFTCAYHGRGIRPHDVRIMAVIFSCQVDILEGNRHFIWMVINSWELVFVSEESDAGNLIGLPQLVRKAISMSSQKSNCPGMLHIEDAALLRLHLNTTTTNLGETKEDCLKSRQNYSFKLHTSLGSSTLRNVYGESEHNGQHGSSTVPISWADDLAGPAPVIRTDELPLLEQRVEAICAYVKEVVKLLTSTAIKELPSNSLISSRDDILNNITKGHFSSLFDEYKARRARMTHPGRAQCLHIRSKINPNCGLESSSYPLIKRHKGFRNGTSCREQTQLSRSAFYERTFAGSILFASRQLL